jgi:hypothetical protein
MSLNQEELNNLLHKLNNKACSVLGHFETILKKDVPDNLKHSFEVIDRNLKEMRAVLLEINSEFRCDDDQAGV